MWNHMVFKDRQVGFGLTQEEAEHDWYVNRCRESLANDTKKIYVQRKGAIYAWLPRRDMLHIANVGCLQYTNGYLCEHKTKKRIVLPCRRFAIYTCMAELFGDTVSYEDIAVVIQEELSEFFQGISKTFRRLEEYPIARVSGRDEAFEPYAVYKLRNGVFVGDAGSSIGVKFLGEEQYHILELSEIDDKQDALMYLCYRTGISFTEGGLGFGQSYKRL